jgi:RhoGAP domain
MRIIVLLHFNLIMLIILLLQFVPLIVEVCIRKIEENGLNNKGIYRVPGNTAAIASLEADIDKVHNEINVLSASSE